MQSGQKFLVLLSQELDAVLEETNATFLGSTASSAVLFVVGRKVIGEYRCVLKMLQSVRHQQRFQTRRTL